MKKVFISAIYYAGFDMDLSVPIEIGDEIYLTEYSKQLHEELGEEFERAIGILELNSLASCDALFIKREVQESDEFDQNLEMYAFIQKIHYFLHVLWLVKDNSANIEISFIKIEMKKREGAHSNQLGKLFTTARGTTEKAIFFESDIKRAVELMSNTTLEREMEPITRLKSEAQRLSVYFYHLQAARNESDIAMKIAHYCVALETIFSSSANEIAHQLAERSAFFLSSNPKERLKIYKSVKEAYGVRSKMNHGATLKQKKISDLLEISVSMDELCRKVYIKIAEDERLHDLYLNNNDIEDYYIELIMGVRENK